MQKNYDVIVVGGGTSGCACAWMAAKLGLKTLLIEKKSYLGGAITAQLVVPAMKTTHNNLNIDFFDELIKKAHLSNAQITYKDLNPGWFNPLRLQNVLENMLHEANCDVMFNAHVEEVKKECIAPQYINNNSWKSRHLLSICVVTNYNDNKNVGYYIDMKHNDNAYEKKVHDFSAKFFVDATGDANFSEIVGANFLPHEKSQAMSLRFIMGGVDKKAFADWVLALDTDRNVTTACEIDGDTHLSTACTWDLAPNWALKPLFDQAVTAGVLKDADRAYFQVFSIAGEQDKLAFNCPRIVSDKDLDPLNQDDCEFALQEGFDAIKRLETFCRLYLRGFENAFVYKIADELGVRESRRVKCKYTLTKEDIYEAKNFKNPVAFSDYPIDVHSVKKDDYTLEYVQKMYSIPLESLMVDGFENLFVVGRCLGADFYAQAAVRIQPTCFSMGEAVAKHIRSVI